MTRRRVDSNQPEIIAALEAHGAVVVPLTELPGREPRAEGLPDLLVAFAGVVMLMEVKTESGRLSRAQRRFLARWPGPWAVVRTPEDALGAIGIPERGECPIHLDSVDADCVFCQRVLLRSTGPPVSGVGKPARGFRFLRERCPECGQVVAANWMVRHLKSGCKIGGKAL